MREGQFDKFRRINVQRCESVFHKLEDWTATDWACALGGEVGEVLNAVKKMKRGDGELQDVADEMGDVFAYMDLLAAYLGIDLWEAIVKKFNEVSDRKGTTIKL